VFDERKCSAVPALVPLNWFNERPIIFGAMSPHRSARTDLLRGIAVLLVLLLHYSLTYRLVDSWLGDMLSPKAIARLVMNGNYGVTIFFTISGFLITSNSLRRYGSLDRTSIRAFYVMRGARILPPLLLALAAILALGLLGLPSFVNKVRGEVLAPSTFGIAIGSVLTFWHNVLMQRIGYFNYGLNIYWSLSVEEVFYLAFPLVCLVFKRGWLFVPISLLIVCGPAYRLYHSDDELYYMYGYLACFDAIAIGCLAAVIAPHMVNALRWARGITIAAALLLASVYWMGINASVALGFSGISLATALLLVSAPPSPSMPPGPRIARLLAAPMAGLRWMGQRSYELYLFHIIVLGLMRDAVPRDALERGYKLPWLLVFLLLSLVVAAVIERYLSSPANRWIRNRYLPATAV
jgi:peptidoglycan/LPS O-acetylase OafA/YrhL